MNSKRLLKRTVACVAFVLASPTASFSTTDGLAPPGGRIGYAMTDRAWVIHQTPDKAECPNGFNEGPREQFSELFPDDDKKRTIKETQLMREGRQWFPYLSDEKFPFHEAGGQISKGINLDSRTDANDFVSPDGVKGIDNQLHRAIGCIANYRAPDGPLYMFELQDLRMINFNRTLIEISDVDDLVDDDDVTVTTYRGLDSLLSDATGSISPGGTQRIDGRWGRDFVQTFKGKIVDGVLTTEPKDLVLPWSGVFNTNSLHFLKAARFELKLTPQRAEGVMGAYVDADAFNRHLNTTWSTHHQSYGQLSAASLYHAIRRLADGYPDSETGRMTAISAAIDVKFTQVFIVHPPEKLVQRDVEVTGGFSGR